MPDPNITEVYLLNVPLENDYRNTLYFPDRDTQTAYFTGKRVSGCSFTDFSYQRKDGCLRIPLQYDTLLSKRCNYVMYKNKAYSNKWFYAFIVNLEYISDGVTNVYIETDAMQTWLFDYTVQPSFIEREHCNNDKPGNNTQPEDFETGPYVTNTFTVYCESMGEEQDTNIVNYTPGSIYEIVIASTVDAFGEQIETDAGAKIYAPVEGGDFYNGVYSGVQYFHFTSKTTANTFINRLAKTGQSDAIQSVFMYPKEFITDDGENLIKGSTIVNSDYWIKESDLPSKVVYRATSIDGYTPENNKLLTYPYCYLMMSNNCGSDVVYHYELFDYYQSEIGKQKCDFLISAAITPGGSIRLMPLRYAGESPNVLQGVTAGKLPVCSWASDVYTNWLTQNGMNLSIAEDRAALSIRSAKQSQAQGMAASGLSALGSLLSGDVGGALSAGVGVAGAYQQGEIAKANGMLDIQSVTAQKYQHSMTPPEAKGCLNAGDVIFAMDKATFTAYHKSIRKEYAKIIDSYFNMYGYASNLVKTPYKNHRENYWFTKTIAVNIDGGIPNQDLNIIKQCYNNGITFWRHTAVVGKYNQSNGIV